MLHHLRYDSRLGCTKRLLTRAILEMSVKNIPQLVSLYT